MVISYFQATDEEQLNFSIAGAEINHFLFYRLNAQILRCLCHNAKSIKISAKDALNNYQTLISIQIDCISQLSFVVF